MSGATDVPPVEGVLGDTLAPEHTPGVGDTVLYGGQEHVLTGAWFTPAARARYRGCGATGGVVTWQRVPVPGEYAYIAATHGPAGHGHGWFWTAGHVRDRTCHIVRRGHPITTLPIGRRCYVPRVGDVVLDHEGARRTLTRVEERGAMTAPYEWGIIYWTLPDGSECPGYYYPTHARLADLPPLDAPAVAPDAPAVAPAVPAVKWRNVLALVPSAATRTVLQLAPTPHLAAYVPARTLPVTAQHAGKSHPVTLELPELAWETALVAAAGAKPLAPLDVRLYAVDAEGREAPWKGGNVWVDSGKICWGTHNGNPASLRAAHAVFWSAPFNSDLWSGKDRHECPEDAPPDRPHACALHEARDRVYRQDPYVALPTSHYPVCGPRHACRDGAHAPDRHAAHACAAASGPADARCRLEHRYPERGSVTRLGLSAVRGRVKARLMHLDTPELVRKFRVTLQRTFQRDDACPCLCCSGHCACAQAFGCPCCAGTCRCLACPCEAGTCGCRTECPCCRERCSCRAGSNPHGCFCDVSLDFARHLAAYRARGHADGRQRTRGTLHIEWTGRTDGAFLSSDPGTVARVPDAWRRKDGGGVTCVAGFARRQPDGAYLVTLPGPTPYTLTLAESEVTLP